MLRLSKFLLELFSFFVNFFSCCFCIDKLVCFIATGSSSCAGEARENSTELVISADSTVLLIKTNIYMMLNYRDNFCGDKESEILLSQILKKYIDRRNSKHRSG